MSDGALPHRRLFIGLVPDAGTRAALIEHQRGWAWPRGSRPTQPANLHLTLFFLDEVDVIHERALRDGLAAEKLAPFDLVLRTPQCWSRGIAVLRPDPQPVLDDLHERIAARLVDADLMPPSGAWKPHVTLARDAHPCTAPEAAAPIVWPVVDFALVWSRRTPPIGHEVLERYGA
ncbi:MAG TPA: 2'-5' RNA ligase family protein [Burkholderiaceae bacterium]|nr:2'-5' RNA ligase family protein [Burkholderiaceae bacterium]